MNKKLMEQLEFIYEIDKIKTIVRKTSNISVDRRENDAEHSWHVCMMALVLEEYSNEKVDIGKVVKMLLIHDLVEIYAGDIIVFEASTKEHAQEEIEAAQKIFGMLPESQGKYFLDLWLEFEKFESNESKFAKAIDRLEPTLQNYKNCGGTWKQFEITLEQIMAMNEKSYIGSDVLRELSLSLINECLDRGDLDHTK